MSLQIRPSTLKDANEFVRRHHRHHKPVIGQKFSISVYDQDTLVGVAICGRPVARAINHQEVLEVTRLCTDGTYNACSILYAACARAAAAMGYQKIQTYILDHEPATSLKASGWTLDALVKGRDWNCPSRGNRRIDQPMVDKQRWAKTLT